MSKPKTTLTLLKRARKFLEAHNWGQDDYYIRSTKTFCAVGALIATQVGIHHVNGFFSEADDEDIGLVSRAQTALGYFVPAGVGIEPYNDDSKTTKDKVLAIYDSAIADLESDKTYEKALQGA